MNQNKKSPTCCQIIGLIFYIIFRIFIILCPVVAQIRVIYILCNKEDFLKHPDQQLLIGLYVVFYLLGYMFYLVGQFVIDNFHNRAQPIKMHIAQTIAGLVVFKIYYELFKWGHSLIYDDDANIFTKFGGTIILTILTVGLFLIYRYFQVICKYWYSQNQCYRFTARFIFGLGIFYIYYKMWQIGLQWYHYEFNRKKYTKMFFGFCLLIFATFGIIILFQFFRFLFANVNSQDPLQRQLSRCILGLIVIYLYFLLLKYGYQWMYQQQPEQEDKVKVFFGFIFLFIGTFGLYLIFKYFEFVCKYWSDDNQWKKELARFLGTLIIPYMIYRIIQKNYRLVKESNSTYEKILGFMVLTIFTFGIILIIQLFKHGHYNIYKQNNFFFEIIGHIELIILTFGLFILYRIIQFTCANWNSQVKWKKQLSRFIGGIGVFYLWYKLIVQSFAALDNRNYIGVQILGRIGLTISTLGLYIFFMIYEYIQTVSTGIKNNYYMSEGYVKGILLLSLSTFGIPAYITLTRNENRLFRFLGHFLLISFNFTVVAFIILYVDWKYGLNKNIKIILIVLFVVVSYPFYTLMREFILYNQMIRKMFDFIMKGLIIFGRAVIFTLAKIYYPISIVLNGLGNSLKKFSSWIQTNSSGARTYFANRKWIWQGYYFRIQTLQQGDQGYTAPTIYEPNITEVEPFKSWEERQSDLINSHEYQLKQFKEVFIFIVKCIIGKTQHEFNHTLHKFSNSEVILWLERYEDLEGSSENIKRYYETHSRLQTVDISDPNNFKQIQLIIDQYEQNIKQISKIEDINYFIDINSGIAAI